MKTKSFLLVASALLIGSLYANEANTLSPQQAAAGWRLLFDGKSLEGWKANEQTGTFSVADGQIIVHGPRSHLFYVGPIGNHDFRNFELVLEVLTRPGANSGVFIHTAWQEAGWPAQGYEVQVNNSHKDPKRTGGLYAVQDNYDPVAQDGTWFTLLIRVEGRRVTTAVDGKSVCDFTEPGDFVPPSDFARRRLGYGTIALQGHDPASQVHYRNIRIRLLP
ncbi:MAG: 3-keto-disaccharide hydrolase [Verrucomicrobiota bacterium]